MIDTKKRSITKALSWRLLAFFLLSVISYAVTGSIKESSEITVAYHTVQVFLFFLHERFWITLRWGRTKGLFVQMTGLSGSGKSTLAKETQRRLMKKGFMVEVIDGDEYREGLCKDLGFSKEDRNTNIRRLGFVGKILSRNDVITIMSAINPYEEVRAEVRKMGNNVKTVFVDCNLDTLIERDTKGLYKKALSGEIKNFTGVSDPFDPPYVCDLTLNTTDENMNKTANKLEKFILENI